MESNNDKIKVKMGKNIEIEEIGKDDDGYLKMSDGLNMNTQGGRRKSPNKKDRYNN
jgi:hypothetical protein